jgi:hypothetical protein
VLTALRLISAALMKKQQARYAFLTSGPIIRASLPRAKVERENKLREF